MYIAMVSAECGPIAKAGGLGDFVQGLSHDLIARGEQVELFLPYYDLLRTESILDLHELQSDLQIPFHGERLSCRILGGVADGIPCCLVDPRSEHGFFRRGRIYGEHDDAVRFAVFCSAVLEFIAGSGRRPDVLHCQDWQTALVPVLLEHLPAERGLAATRVCYTLHNVGYQGQVPASILAQVGLDPASLLVPELLLDPAGGDTANLMKGGILYADFVNTVSPRYAWEIQNTDQGMGLQPLLQEQAHKFGGILNGIDSRVWGPETDRLIPVNYGPASLPLKAANRKVLRHRLGLAEVDKPIFGIVSRLDRQKGVDLILHGIQYALDSGAQVVLLGSALEPEIDARFQRLKQATAEGHDCRIELLYDEALAHLIFAGSDLTLVPSLYEPCGLTQLIAMKYGVVPIVRRVGGLADTVFDANYSDKSFKSRNGYLFDDPTPSALEGAMQRALALWQRYPEYFRQLRVNGMRGDYSWRESGARYLELYQGLRAS